jgi:hypothetical protein
MVSVTFPSNCSGQQNVQMYVPPAGYAKLQLGLAVDYCSVAARVSAVAVRQPNIPNCDHGAVLLLVNHASVLLPTSAVL